MVYAARVVLDNPGNASADEHFKLLKEQWSEGMDKLRGHVDASMDTVNFIKASEEGILRDTGGEMEDRDNKKDEGNYIDNKNNDNCIKQIEY